MGNHQIAAKASHACQRRSHPAQRRVALAGYIAIAPDGLSSVGGAPEDQEAARDLFAKTDGGRIVQDILAAVPWLAADPVSNGKIGVVGFCYGGGVALRAAIENIGVDSAVAYYGKPLSAEDTKRLKIPVMMHYAGNDGTPRQRTARALAIAHAEDRVFARTAGSLDLRGVAFRLAETGDIDVRPSLSPADRLSGRGPRSDREERERLSEGAA